MITQETIDLDGDSTSWEETMAYLRAALKRPSYGKDVMTFFPPSNITLQPTPRNPYQVYFMSQSVIMKDDPLCKVKLTNG